MNEDSLTVSLSLLFLWIILVIVVCFYLPIESRRFSSVRTRASSEETSVDAGELFTDLKEKVRIRALFLNSL